MRLSSSNVKCIMKKLFLLAALGGMPLLSAWAQCGNGVPSAGNPGCIPPDQINSPYYQGGGNSPPPAVWESRWGSIALCSTVGRFGATENKSSRSKAEQEALGICTKKGGIDCKIVISYDNECGAFFQKIGGGWTTAAAMKTKALAESAAMKSCEEHTGAKCEFVYSGCSMPVRVQ